MATRKPAAKRPPTPAAGKTAAKAPRASAAKSPRKTAAVKAASKTAPRKRVAAPRKRADQHSPVVSIDEQTPDTTIAATPPEVDSPKRRRLSANDRERRFNTLLQAACLKAGTAAAISTISSKVPFLGRLTPLVLGSVGETLVLAKVQQQLVRDTMALYELELSDAEERGVILLATAVNIGAQQISKASVEQLIEQITGRLYRPVISHVLPLASVATEVAASVASTYAVGKRAQALCQLPGTGARDLGEWLRNMSGIDQARLYKWTGDAFALALKPFRGVLMAMVPGMSLISGKKR